MLQAYALSLKQIAAVDGWEGLTEGFYQLEATHEDSSCRLDAL